MKLRFDPASIQFRLTAGIILASILSTSGITGWSLWRMRQILVDGHKENASNVAERLSQDVDLYQEMMPSATALQKAINYRSTANVAIWLRTPQGQILAQSDTLTMGSWQKDGFAKALMDTVHQDMPLGILHLRDRYLVVCNTPLILGETLVGQIYVVDDVTQNQKSFHEVTRTLMLASAFAITLGTLLVAWYVRHSLAPIGKINQLAANIVPTNLANTRLEFDRAPTEVQELAQACNMMLARLADAWEQQRRFVGDVSHELRTPLTIVHGYLQSTLRRCNTLTEIQREGLEIAASEAERTIKLLQDLLDVARAEGGHLRFNIEALPIQAAIGEVIDMCHYRHDRLQTKMDIPNLAVKADRHRLKQVLINLIDNAMKYSDASEPVTITVKHLGEWATIDICDRGRGIPATDLHKIFEPFYRVDDDRSRTTGGTGLGLSIVKLLVEGMHGKLKVKSVLGEGSTFTVMLPT
jgi:signal transduction histidine kinase